MLQKIVRPFQTLDVTPPRRVIGARGNSVAGVKLEIGKSGSGKTLNGSGSAKVTYYMDSHYNEIRILGVRSFGGFDDGSAFYTGMGQAPPPSL